MVKIYWTIWAMFALAAAVLFASGYFTQLMAVVFGFFAFGLVFMGMISVLPSMVSHPAAPEYPAETVEARVPAEAPAPAPSGGFGVLKSA